MLYAYKVSCEVSVRLRWTEFESSEDKHVALSSSEDLWKQNYLVCPSLTPPHLPSWGVLATPTNAGDPHQEAAEDEEKTDMYASSQVR